MTTIAVSRSLMMMASDGNMTVDGRKHISDAKLFRTREYICGCAGNSDAIVRFREWLKTRDGKQPKGAYSALLLYRDGRIEWIEADDTLMIEEDYFATGTGASFAISSMDTLRFLGLVIDPRIAVQVACVRDTMSAEPVHYLRWKNACA